MKKAEKKVLRNLIVPLIIIVVLTLALAIGFYLGFLNKLPQKPTEETQEDRGGSQEFSLEEASNLPDIFPKDFPVYKRSEVSSSFIAKGDNTQGVSVIWETEDSQREVFAFYQRELESTGWQITSKFEKEDSFTISFNKEKMSGFIGIARVDERTVIAVTIGIKGNG